MTTRAASFTIVIGGVVTLAATADVAGIDLQLAGEILRLRLATRQREKVDNSTTRIGFRCPVRVGA